MKMDRNKIYGYSAEYMLEHGEPADNMSDIQADFDDVLTRSELAHYFPNQWLILEQVDHNGYPEEGHFKTAKVRYYKCNPDTKISLLKQLKEEEPDKAVLFVLDSNWDDKLEGIIWG